MFDLRSNSISRYDYEYLSNEIDNKYSTLFLKIYVHQTRNNNSFLKEQKGALQTLDLIDHKCSTRFIVYCIQITTLTLTFILVQGS